MATKGWITTDSTDEPTLMTQMVFKSDTLLQFAWKSTELNFQVLSVQIKWVNRPRSEL